MLDFDTQQTKNGCDKMQKEVELETTNKTSSCPLKCTTLQIVTTNLHPPFNLSA